MALGLPFGGGMLTFTSNNTKGMPSAGFEQLFLRTAYPLLLFILPFTLQGQISSITLASRIDSIFTGQVHKPIPGYAVAVIKAGKLIHHKGYGLASLEHNIPIDTSTRKTLS